MTLLYNRLYNNKKYINLANLVALAMGENIDNPSQKYLDLMVKIQNKAMELCQDIERGKPENKLTAEEFNILGINTDSDIFTAYCNFLELFTK